MSTEASPLTSEQIRFLSVGMAGSLLVSLSAQLPSTNIADLQGALFATPDEASWVLTVYAMASLVGVVTSGLFIRALSIGRYMVASAVVFATAALACATGPELGVAIWLRAIQGFAAGGFGPAAFVAAFMVAGPGGPRLPSVVSVLALVLLVPGTLGPVISGFVEDGLGWQALFLVQASIGAALAVAARIWVPHKDSDWSALKADWAGVILLSVAVATLILVFNQGTRQFWFESEMIVWSTAACIGAAAGFGFLARFSPLPIISPKLLLTQKFGIPIGLNLAFRVALVVTAYLVPQFLAVVHGYRPLEVAKLMLWAAVAQLLVFPLAWRLMHLVDTRVVMALGLMLCAAGTTLAINVTNLSGAEQFRLTLVLFAVGQVLFLAPALVIGASGLKFADLPTASVFFNLTTLGGTTIGVGLASHLVAEREKFHSNVLTESVSLYDALDAYRVAGLAEALTSRAADGAGATAQALALVTASARREAWVLSFADAFFVVAVVLVVAAVGVVAIGRSQPLGLVSGEKR
jgi:MFS transporter, DHA2 family, multidrug resistance protein